MASTVEIESFRHEGLPDPRTYIRLLEICSVDEARDFPFHCKLTPWLRAKAPKYTAVSYAWGDPQQLAVILVNGKRMEVRRNCEYILKQAYWDKARYLWIDAICINQTDNDEKSSQVAMMGDIYKSAGRVLACVGRHEDDSEFLFEKMRKERHIWKNTYEEVMKPSFRFRLWLRFTSRPIMERVHVALVKFLQRPYFQRVWIHQELFHGRRIQVCCEDHKVKGLWFRGLYQAFMMVDFFMLPSLSPEGPSPRLTLQTLEVRFLMMKAIAPKIRLNLCEVMVAVARWQSEDARDRVYGTLSMVEWEDTEPIQPDYSMNSSEVAFEVLRRMGNDGQFLTLFAYLLIVARNLRLIGSDLSQIDMVQQCRSSGSKAPPVSPTATPGDYRTIPMTRFWGKRLCFHDATWQLRRQPSGEGADCSEPKLQNETSLDGDGTSPIIQKWSKGHNLDLWGMDILLSQEAEHGDWLLAPSYPYSDQRGREAKESREHEVACDVLFVAREADDGRLTLVGKALSVRRIHWPTRMTWEKAWGDGSSQYGVHLDSEDALLLGYTCGWSANVLYHSFTDDRYETSAVLREQRKPQVDRYFETKLCGERSCSYVVPIEFSRTFNFSTIGM